MRMTLLLALLVALAAPVAAFADGSTPPTTASTANQTCKQEQTTMGTTLFAQTYGGKANAWGKCVSSHAKSATTTNANAAQSCKTQQADPSFATNHGGKSFDQFYGTNSGSKGKGNGSNAFGKCVSMAVSQATTAQASTETNAAKTCKASRSSDPTGFSTKWGTGKNSFGKCVAATAKTK
jgi:hypothetical protein